MYLLDEFQLRSRQKGPDFVFCKTSDLCGMNHFDEIFIEKFLKNYCIEFGCLFLFSKCFYLLQISHSL